MPAWVDTAVQTYRKRLPRQLDFHIQGLAPPRRSASSAAATRRKQEAEILLGAVPPGTHTVALDERGALWSSAELSSQLERWQGQGAPVALLVGGADGLDESCRQHAAQVWSLSPLTLPHALVRAVLAEQLYRAWTMLEGHPYHRD